MPFFKKKQPVEQEKPLTPQDFQQSDDIPMQQEYEPQDMPIPNQYPPRKPMVQRMQEMGERVDNAVQNFSGAVYNPQPMPPQPPQQVVPQVIKQAVQQPQQPMIDIDSLKEAIIELDVRLNHIESWLFRRSK